MTEPAPNVIRFVRLGVDVGQAADPSAFAVVEGEQAPGMTAQYRLRHLRRLPLGTPYTEVADEVFRAVSAIAERSRLKPEVYIDATGIGWGVIDIVVDRLREVAILRPIEIGFGEAMHTMPEYTSTSEGMQRRRSKSGLRVGKAYLVGRLKAIIQTGAIKAAPTPEFEALKHELLTFEVRTNERTLKDKYGAMKTGEHDDMVIALALAVLHDAITEPTELDGVNKTLGTDIAAPEMLRMGPRIAGWQW